MKSLYTEMKQFQSEKKKYIVVLMLLGVLGLIFPVIPGLLFIGLGIALISPKHGEVFLAKIKDWLKSLTVNFKS